MGRIETGVDRLVELIQDKKKITVDKAAKELGVSDLVVTEWAEFLAEEKLITIDYSLSKVYLKERELTKADVEKKAKQYGTKKEAFVRKIDSSLAKLEREGKGLESVKKEFDDLRGAIGKQLEEVQDELKELKKYEDMRKQIDTDIEEEIGKYKEQIDKASTSIKSEQKKYDELLGSLDVEERKLKKKRKEIKDFEKMEEDFLRKADALEDMLDEAREKVVSHKDDMQATHKHIDSLSKQASTLKKELLSIKKQRIDPLKSEREEHEKMIDELKEKIIKKAEAAKDVVSEDVKIGTKAVKDFEKFFNKRLEVEKLVKAADAEKGKIEKELEELKKAAISFKVASKQDVEDHIKELEDKYQKLEKQREGYKGKLTKLMDTIFD